MPKRQLLIALNLGKYIDIVTIGTLYFKSKSCVTGVIRKSFHTTNNVLIIRRKTAAGP